MGRKEKESLDMSKNLWSLLGRDKWIQGRHLVPSVIILHF